MDANWGHHFHFNNPNLQMNIHGSYTINFVLFNYFRSKHHQMFAQILKNLWFHQIHKQTIIDSEKSPTNRHITMRYPICNLCFYNTSCEMSTSNVLSNYTCTFWISKSDEDHIWMGAIDGIFSSIPLALSTKQHAPSSTIEHKKT